MKFKQGASVATLDGKEAGHVIRVVVDPKTKKVTHLVVRRGLLQKEDKVVPINVVLTGPDGQLSVQLDSTELERLPAFAEEEYVAADENQEGNTPATVMLYPPYPGGVPGIASYGPQYVAETHLNIPDNTVALKEGAKVLARDQKEVGHIRQVLTSTPADQVTHFVIAKGLLVREYRLIPVGWVERLADDAVYLVVDSAIIERLPVIEPV